MRYQQGLFLAVLALVGVPALAAAAEESPLAQVPDNVAAVVHLRGIDGTKGRLKDLVRTALPGRDGLQAAGMIDQSLRDVLGERKLDGLAADGPVFLALVDLPRLKPGLVPPLVLIARVTDYEAFRNGLLTVRERDGIKSAGGIDEARANGTPVFFVKRQDFAVIALERKVAARFIGKFGGLDRTLDKEVARRLLAADLSLWVDMAAVNDAYGEQIQEFRQMLELWMVDDAKQKGLDKDMIELAKKFAGLVYQAIKDNRGLLLTAGVANEGVSIHAEAQVGKGTKTDAFLKAEKKSALKEIGLLPADQYVFEASHPSTNDILGPAMHLLIGDTSKGQGKAIKEALDLAEKSRPFLELKATRQRGGLEGVSVTLCQDPAKAAEGSLKLYQAQEPGAGLLNVVLKEKPQVRPDAQRHRGFQLHHVRLVMDLEKMARLVQADVEELKKDVGEEEQVWFGSNGKVFVEVRARDWPAARAQLDSYLDGKNNVGERKAFQEARKHLPTEATFLYIEELSLYIQSSMEHAAKQAGRKPPKVPRPAVGKEDYWGMSLTLQASRADADLWVPSAWLRDYMKIAVPFYSGR